MNILKYSVTVSAAAAAKKKTHYLHVKKYEILQCGAAHKFTWRRKHSEGDPLYFVAIEDTYDIIKRAQIELGMVAETRCLKTSKNNNNKKSTPTTLQSPCHSLSLGVLSANRNEDYQPQ